MRVTSILLSMLFAVSCGSSAYADIESERLTSGGAWLVDVNHNTSDGDLFCDAYSVNTNGQQIRLTAFNSGNLLLSIHDTRWAVQAKIVDFIIDIDYSRWTIRGEAAGSSVFVFPDSGEKAGRFLEEISQGSAVAVYSKDLRRLATFSLRGSSTAMTAFIGCWGMISVDDPFTTASDPF